ncbi:D-aminopeptidase [Actinorhabdospora filicis]|uniref:D-aminopeptidase n=1 Tax=Actinorhabdospora filicis TaxID=1785913 RepID=A0A9W6SQ32_9ACTN|nr:P1 family peptidase [Actinorhabdospora filicis]GLZ80283.1 D-aminopeptidase [Actinorhabdospora filicis]
MSRARDLGLRFAGVPGPHNAITDVPGVTVGHTTVRRGAHVHTGVTALVTGATPDRPRPAGVFAGNGFGKLVGYTQVAELGVVESPVLLTSTLSAFRVADALVTWMLARHDATTFNPVVGECNDGFLSDIRARAVTGEDVLSAIESASGGPVAEGSVGAGTGTSALGFKAGIGTASRVVDGATLGVLVQANFGGTLRVGGAEFLPPAEVTEPPEDGSCMILAATDAGLDARQLTRLSRRLVFALGRVGASYSHGSGDYGLAIGTVAPRAVADPALSPLFEAALDAVEEAVLNSLVAARTTVGVHGRVVPGIPVDRLRATVVQ